MTTAMRIAETAKMMKQLLTPEEQAYIDSADPITVKTYVEHKLMGYLNGAGELAGILPNYLDKPGELCSLMSWKSRKSYVPRNRRSYSANASSSVN